MAEEESDKEYVCLVRAYRRLPEVEPGELMGVTNTQVRGLLIVVKVTRKTGMGMVVRRQ